mmetsp:Transcript_126076/g.315038  ORF Transcript_126076/g.315038 Transcript_126076/m.315038 type:complete len:421 (-) Transcript_126076:253-1515(-)
MPTVLKRPAAAAAAGSAAKKHKPAAAKPAAAKPKPAPAKAKNPPKPKRDPLLVSVSAGLALSKELPDTAKSMLGDMLDFALTLYKEDRHQYQQNIVELVESTLGDVEKGLETSLEEAQNGIKQSEDKKESCTSIVQDNEAKLVDQSAVVQKRKHELADAARAFRATRESVNDIKISQDLAEQDLKKAQCDKEKLEAALADYFQPLLAAGASAGDETGQEKVDCLTLILKKFNMDEAMMTAVPMALLKEPGVRGPFDTMVISQLEAEVNNRIVAYDTTLKEAEPAKAERAARLEEASGAFEEAKKAQLACAEAFWEASKGEESRQSSLLEAKQSVSEAGKEARRFQKDAEKAERALSNFRNGPQAAFLQLRDRTAPPPEEPPAEVEAPAQAAAADAEMDAAKAPGGQAGAADEAPIEVSED